MTGMTRHKFDRIQRIKESKASVDCRESLEKVKAHFSVDWSCTSEQFGIPEIQGPSESGDATDARGNALDTLTADGVPRAGVLLEVGPRARGWSIG
jgi:hypothetical protein